MKLTIEMGLNNKLELDLVINTTSDEVEGIAKARSWCHVLDTDLDATLQAKEKFDRRGSFYEKVNEIALEQLERKRLDDKINRRF